MVIYQLLLDDPNYQQDKIDLTYSLLPKDVQDSISRTTYTRGVKELRNVNFLAPTMHDGVYWINIDYVFKGDRLTLVNQYILDGATEVDPKTYDAITLRRTRMPQKERPRKTGTGTPVTFPTKFSERMRAAMFPTKFKVCQIEFLARETPNCTLPRTYTHPHQWTCESVAVRISGSVATREASAASL